MSVPHLQALMEMKKHRKLTQNKKSKRKQNIVRKAQELAEIANLKIAIIIYDPEQNVL